MKPVFIVRFKDTSNLVMNSLPKFSSKLNAKKLNKNKLYFFKVKKLRKYFFLKINKTKNMGCFLSTGASQKIDPLIGLSLLRNSFSSLITLTLLIM